MTMLGPGRLLRRAARPAGPIHEADRWARCRPRPDESSSSFDPAGVLAPGRYVDGIEDGAHA